MPRPVAEPRKILLRSPNWVGDAIMATPVAAALKKKYPQAELHVLARPWVAPLWHHHPWVDQVSVTGKKGGLRAWLRETADLRRGHYDLTLLLTDAFSAAWLAFWSGIPRRIGYRADNRGWLLTESLARPRGNVARPESYLALAGMVGAETDEKSSKAFSAVVTAEELEQARQWVRRQGTQKLVGLAPGSVAPSRRWPVERYAQIADRLAEAGHQVVLVGSPADGEIAQTVARLAQNNPVVTAGKTDLRQGLAVIRLLDLLVSNDSGAMHMAYAQDVPVLVLQGAADPRVTGPFGRHSAYLRDETLDCAPCVRNQCRFKELKCMLHLDVDRVWDKIRSMLDRGAGK